MRAENRRNSARAREGARKQTESLLTRARWRRCGARAPLRPMTKNAMVLFLTLALSACGSSGAATASPEGGGEGAGGEHAAGHGHGDEAPPEPTRVLEDGSRLFGSEMSAERETTPLATIVASPDQFEGQVVKTEGEISQVCQSMGCWMELRTDAEAPASASRRRTTRSSSHATSRGAARRWRAPCASSRSARSAARTSRARARPPRRRR